MSWERKSESDEDIGGLLPRGVGGQFLFYRDLIHRFPLAPYYTLCTSKYCTSIEETVNLLTLSCRLLLG